MSSSTAKSAKKNRQFWQRRRKEISAVIGSVHGLGNRLVIDFEYAPQRVATIKAIPGSRFNGDEKTWSIPVEALPEFESKSLFARDELLWSLPESTVLPCDNHTARLRLRDNPFSVPEDVIATLPIDLVIRLNREKHRLRLIPRFSSPAHSIITKTAGATYSAVDSAYTIPVTILPAILKILRDNGLNFAIDEYAGETLKGSAELRARVVSGELTPTADDLTRAILVPFLTIGSTQSGESSFRPCFFTKEQFVLAFRGVTRKGAQGRFELHRPDLAKVWPKIQALPFPVWTTGDVQEQIRALRQEITAQVANDDGSGVIEDLYAELGDLPASWSLTPAGRGLLIIRESESGLRSVAVEELKGSITKLTENDRLTAAEIPDTKLLSAVTTLELQTAARGAPLIAQSKSFHNHLEVVRKRLARREQTAYLASLSNLATDQLPGLENDQIARLFPHQRVALRWLLDTPYAFLGDDMGLGKTLSILSYFASLKAQKKAELLLVVCPNSLTRNWIREFGQWFPELKGTLISGDRASKAWALRLLNSGAIEFDLIVVNYEAVRLPYITPELENLVTNRETLLCLDESQRVKNPTSKTFKALTGIASRCKRRVLLSGTPTPRDVSDLWAQLRLLDGGERLGKSYYRWLESIAELGNEHSDYAVKRFIPEEVAESVARVQEILLRRRKEQVINLPPKTFLIRDVKMTGNQRERYDEIREGLLIRMRSLSGEQYVRDITNILEEYLRAVQVASNPRLIDPQWSGTPAKFAELDEIVNEVVEQNGGKIVIWSNYLGNIRELTDRYKHLGAASFSGEVSAVDRDNTVRAFQNGADLRILVAVPAAGGVGITLTAAQTAVYMDKTWNAEHWMQSVDRIHRIGQKGTVSIVSLLACKVDEIMHWSLVKKERAQAEVLGDHGESNQVIISRTKLIEALEPED